MTDIKLILNIQLFAEDGNGDAGENGEFGIRNSEFAMKENGANDVLDEKEEKSEMNEEVESDVLEDEASENEEKENIKEETEDETEDEKLHS